MVDGANHVNIDVINHQNSIEEEKVPDNMIDQDSLVDSQKYFV